MSEPKGAAKIGLDPILSEVGNLQKVKLINREFTSSLSRLLGNIIPKVLIDLVNTFVTPWVLEDFITQNLTLLALIEYKLDDQNFEKDFKSDSGRFESLSEYYEELGI